MSGKGRLQAWEASKGHRDQEAPGHKEWDDAWKRPLEEWRVGFYLGEMSLNLGAGGQ